MSSSTYLGTNGLTLNGLDWTVIFTLTKQRNFLTKSRTKDANEFTLAVIAQLPNITNRNEIFFRQLCLHSISNPVKIS